MALKQFVANANEIFEVIEKAKPPYGHEGYSRMTPTGKVEQIAPKGVKPVKAENQILVEAMKINPKIRGAIFDVIRGIPKEEVMKKHPDVDAGTVSLVSDIGAINQDTLMEALQEYDGVTATPPFPKGTQMLVETAGAIIENGVEDWKAEKIHSLPDFKYTDIDTIEQALRIIASGEYQSLKDSWDEANEAIKDEAEGAEMDKWEREVGMTDKYDSCPFDDMAKSKQKKHTRMSKKGKPFQAGSGEAKRLEAEEGRREDQKAEAYEVVRQKWDEGIRDDGELHEAVEEALPGNPYINDAIDDFMEQKVDDMVDAQIDERLGKSRQTRHERMSKLGKPFQAGQGEVKRGPFYYKVTAVGHGTAFNKYPMEFEIGSNYDMDKDDDSYAAVHRKAKGHAEDAGAFSGNSGYVEIKSIEKLNKADDSLRSILKGVTSIERRGTLMNMHKSLGMSRSETFSTPDYADYVARRFPELLVKASGSKMEIFKQGKQLFKCDGNKKQIVQFIKTYEAKR